MFVQLCRKAMTPSAGLLSLIVALAALAGAAILGNGPASLTEDMRQGGADFENCLAAIGTLPAWQAAKIRRRGEEALGPTVLQIRPFCAGTSRRPWDIDT